MCFFGGPSAPPPPPQVIYRDPPQPLVGATKTINEKMVQAGPEPAGAGSAKEKRRSLSIADRKSSAVPLASEGGVGLTS